jgi:hypothetical protein
VVLLDLDARDGLLVAVENKLFTTNSPGQLEAYHQLIEQRYARASVLEYVYLTLDGQAPVDHGDLPERVNRSWVRMSWVEDVLAVLEEMTATGNRDVVQLRQVLAWLQVVLDRAGSAEFSEAVNGLFGAMVTVATGCIFAELERLGEGAAGLWRIVREGKGATRLVHSSKPRSPLYVGVMPNLSIALYGRRSRRRPFDKLLIPFGSNPDQVFNLMDHAARDIYPLHFGENYRRYLGPQRRLTAREVPERQAGRKLLAQVHRWRHEIQLLAQVARRSGTRPTGRDEQGGPLLPADHFEGHRPDQPDS